MNTKTAIALLFSFIVVLGICRSDLISGSAAERKKIHLSYWNGFTGPDGAVMLNLVRRFNEANPDVEVTMQRMDWNTYYNKLMVAALDGRGPEVFVLQSVYMPRMHRAGFIDDVSDLFRGPDPLPVKDYEPVVLNQVRYDKGFAGLPLDIWPYGLYYNADMFKAAGIVNAAGNAKPPLTGEEFIADATKLRQGTGGNDTDLWGFALDDWAAFYEVCMFQFGGELIDKNGRAVMDNPNNLRALHYMSDLRTKYRLMPPPQNALGWVGYRTKKVAMVVDGVFMLGDLKSLNDFHYMGAPVPQFGDHQATLAGSHVLCIRKDISPAQREAGARFLKFLSNNSIDWADAGQVPARRTARSNPRFAKMQVQSGFAKQIPYIHYMPLTAIQFELGVEVNLAVEKVIRGRATPEEALKVANTNLQGILDRDSRERKQEKVSQ